MTRDYATFLEAKLRFDAPSGFDPGETMNAQMFPFQRAIARWACRRGRSAVWADCGLGKTIISLEWLRLVTDREGGSGLVLTPLAVAEQFAEEGEKFGIAVNVCRDGADVRPGINVTNYERLHRFDPSKFVAVVADESSILKDYSSATRNILIDSFSRTPYRMACTATPAPNDHIELGNHAEFLGALTRTEMLSTFFVHDGGDTQSWRLKRHAARDFWRWVWKAPIGYRHAEHRDGRPVGLELDPEQAPHVAYAFELVAGGVTVDAAFRECTAAGLVNPKGKPIGRQTFHAIFQKPIYAGRLEVSAWSVDVASAAPAIVTEETWSRARRAIATRSPARRQTATLEDFPLRGITRCACGRKLAAYHARGRNKNRWPYYRCQRCAVQIPQRLLGDAFERLLTRVAAPEAAVLWVDRLITEAIQRRATEMQTRLAQGQRRLATTEARLERLLAMRVDGEITPEEFATSRARLTTDRDEARLELAELTTPLDIDFGIASSWARRLLTQPAEVWAGLAPELRAQFVERVFPEGLVFEDGEFSNRSKCLLQLPLRPVSGKEEDLVGQPGRSSNHPDLFTWCTEFRTLEPFARAA